MTANESLGATHTKASNSPSAEIDASTSATTPNTTAGWVRRRSAQPHGGVHDSLGSVDHRVPDPSAAAVELAAGDPFAAALNGEQTGHTVVASALEPSLNSDRRIDGGRPRRPRLCRGTHTPDRCAGRPPRAAGPGQRSQRRAGGPSTCGSETRSRAQSRIQSTPRESVPTSSGSSGVTSAARNAPESARLAASRRCSASRTTLRRACRVQPRPRKLHTLDRHCDLRAQESEHVRGAGRSQRRRLTSVGSTNLSTLTDRKGHGRAAVGRVTAGWRRRTARHRVYDGDDRRTAGGAAASRATAERRARFSLWPGVVRAHDAEIPDDQTEHCSVRVTK